MMQRTVRMATWRALSLAAPFTLAAYYELFLDKNFEQYLIICSPRAKHVWEFKGHFQHLLQRAANYMLYTLYEDLRLRFALRRDSTFSWPRCIAGYINVASILNTYVTVLLLKIMNTKYLMGYLPIFRVY